MSLGGCGLTVPQLVLFVKSWSAAEVGGSNNGHIVVSSRPPCPSLGRRSGTIGPALPGLPCGRGCQPVQPRLLDCFMHVRQHSDRCRQLAAHATSAAVCTREVDPRGEHSLHSQPLAPQVSASEQVVLQAPQFELVSREVSQPAAEGGMGGR